MHLSDFAGLWHLSRRIDDRLAGQHIAASGEARLEGGRWEETVQMLIPGQAPLEGHREYLWRSVSGGVAVSFEDGRPFHHINLGGCDSADTHLCDPDHYRVHYRFADWPDWRTVWTVRGPRKNYVMETGFCRTRKTLLQRQHR